MITLIAESKTMSSCERHIPIESFACHKPHFENEAAEIIAFIKQLDPIELSQRISTSRQLGVKSSLLAYEFPNKQLGYNALDAFTGEVFKALHASSLSNEQRDYANVKLRIISSLYGILAPDNIIKPYRLDFNSDCSPEGLSLTQFWKTRLTIYFVKWLKTSNENEILNLLPSEASKYLDWKIIKAFANVEKPDFKMVTDNGNLKTPHSSKLKELRGIFARTIIDEKIDSLASIRTLSTPYFTADTQESKHGTIRFISIS